VRHREKSQEWLRFFGTIFVVVGLALNIDGAWTASKPVVLTEHEAVEMGKGRWASPSLEENLKLPQVRAMSHAIDQDVQQDIRIADATGANHLSQLATKRHL
jgi:hypothetical protein